MILKTDSKGNVNSCAFNYSSRLDNYSGPVWVIPIVVTVSYSDDTFGYIQIEITVSYSDSTYGYI